MFSLSRFLPLLIIVFVLAFSVKLTEVITGVSDLSAVAYAESSDKDEEKHAEAEDTHAADGDEPSDAPHEVDDGDAMAKAPKWRDASDSDIDVTGVKAELFEDLAARRKKLDQAEKQLQTRQALLLAAEKEIDRKYQELSKLRTEIESLLDRQSEEEDLRIKSLVKIYEGMKPKDSARIFDTLDIDVLVSVISLMSERKVSPVLAAMSPERARTVTIMLAEKSTLPKLQ